MGKLSLGIELGSTRIKAVLIDENQHLVATGYFEWENKLENGIWTYELEEVWKGIQSSYAMLKADYFLTFGQTLKHIDAMGVSAMMHGYLALNAQDQLLTPFRTWRNTNSKEAATKLTELFQFNIPQRWSIAHLYQAFLNEEEHLKDLSFLTTLAGYVHYVLTGEKVLGIGDASGMFPIDSKQMDYNQKMLHQFQTLIECKDYDWQIEKVLPTVKVAGETSGMLTESGAKLIDVTGDLASGVVFCPPEGDAATGMMATNSIKAKTGNISVGTSIFAMLVLEDHLSKIYPEIDHVATPSGKPVAMVHANNCSHEINAWLSIFAQCSKTIGFEISLDQLYEKLFKESLKADSNGGGLLIYGYLSGEHLTEIPEGRQLLVRNSKSVFTLPNLMRSQFYSAFATIALGMKILTEDEGVQIDHIFGHGGLFKTKDVAARHLASAFNTTISIMDSADFGGAWGMALLADYLNAADEGLRLEDYLEEKVFKSCSVEIYTPNPVEHQGFEAFLEKYKSGLSIVLSAIENF